MSKHFPQPNPTDPKAPETLPEMRAAMIQDQRELNAEIFRNMGVPSAQRAEMIKGLEAIAQKVIAEMPDDDVRRCFE